MTDLRRSNPGTRSCRNCSDPEPRPEMEPPAGDGLLQTPPFGPGMTGSCRRHVRSTVCQRRMLEGRSPFYDNERSCRCEITACETRGAPDVARCRSGRTQDLSRHPVARCVSTSGHCRALTHSVSIVSGYASINDLNCGSVSVPVVAPGDWTQLAPIAAPYSRHRARSPSSSKP